MIGVILHKRRATGQVGGNHLHRSDQGTGFPIALPAKAKAIRHQTLHSQARQLLEAMQNLKVSRKALEVVSREKTAQTKLNSRTVAKRIGTGPSLPQFFRYCVALLVLGAKFANCVVTYAIHIRDEITDAVG